MSVFSPAPIGTVVTPQMFGGRADGDSATPTDNGPAMAAAAQAAVASGVELFVPAGHYWANSTSWDGAASLPAGLRLRGARGTTFTWQNPVGIGYPLFNIAGDDVRVRGLTFTHPAGGSAITSSAGLQRLVVDKCDFLGACINRLFACAYSSIRNCRANGALTRAALVQPLNAGTMCGALQVDSVQVAIPTNALLYVYLYPDGVYAPGMFQTVTTTAAVPVGAAVIPVVPFLCQVSLPVGAVVQEIVVSTAFSMTGQYTNWSSAPLEPGPSWVVKSAIEGCTAMNCNAANMFINMGYRSQIKDCLGIVAHDTGLDLEYCVQSKIVHSTQRFGGNRCISVELVNSECEVGYCTATDCTSEDGIRVTTDYVPAANPYSLGGHRVHHCTTERCYWGIAFQGTWGRITHCTSRYNVAAGVHLENAPDPGSPEKTVLKYNTLTHNYGVGMDTLNTGNPEVGPNEIAFNGWLGGQAPPRSAPQLTVEAGTSSFAADSVAVSYAWYAGVPAMGTTQALQGAPSLPAVAAVTGAGQVIAFDVTPPPGMGVAVGVQSLASYLGMIPWYNRPAQGIGELSVLVPPRVLGYVDAGGNVTYSGSATGGITVTPQGGHLHIVVSAEAASNAVSPAFDWSNGAGVWFNPGTGANTNARIGATIHDNGYAGVYGAASGVALDVARIRGHTALCV